MYERRLRGLLLLYAAVFGLIAAQVFSVQVLGAGGHAEGLEERNRRYFTLMPRRGEIHFADGAPMAANEPDYSVHVDFERLDDRLLPGVTHVSPDLRATYRADLAAYTAGARRVIWECAPCGRRVKERRAPVSACRGCRSKGGFRMLPAPDAADLAHLLEFDGRELADAFAASLARWRRNRKHALHPLLDSVPRATARRLRIASRRFPAFVPKPTSSRWVHDDAATLVGRTRSSWEDDRALTDTTRALEGKHVYSLPELYATRFGASGLELAFVEELRGVPGRAYRTLLGRGKGLSEPVVERPVEDGAALRTTLRPKLQRLAQEIVDGAREPDGPDGAKRGEYRGAAAIVLDARTGAVLAIASKNVKGLHRAVCHVRPGSVFKLVTAVALLDAGLDPAEELECRGRGRTPGGQSYRCMHHHGPIALREAFEKSCNYYFGAQAERVGRDGMAAACERLGLGRAQRLCFPDAVATRSGLEYTSPGAANRNYRWFVQDLYRIGIGQGKASASPLQMALAYARVANGGHLIRPYLLERDRPAPGSVEVDAELARDSALLREAARRVVVSGTARNCPELGVARAAGKTGTADLVARPGDVGYPGREFVNNAWFVGYAPHDDPRYVAVVVFERVAGYGGGVSGDHVGRLLQEAAR